METFKKIFQPKFLLPIALLIGLTFYGFRDMTKMIPQGEGFMWITSGQQTAFWKSIPSSLANFEVSAVLMGTLLSNLFGLHLHLYYLAWLLVMILINILLFIMVYFITKNILVSFSASLIFAVNYCAHWGMIGWTYTSFLERTITIVFLIPSFMFLHRYLEKSRLHDFLFSISLFLLALWIGQWGLIFAGAYMAYPLFWFLFKDKTRKLLLKRILMSCSYFFICCFFFFYLHPINQAGVGPRYSFTYFLLHPQEFQYTEQIPLQLTRWSQYPVLLKGVRAHKPYYKGSNVQYFADIEGGNKIVWQVTLVYLIAAAVIFFKLRNHRPFLFTLILGIFSLFLINTYIGRYYPEWQPGPHRYLYLPTIWLSIFWALLLWAVFWKKKGWLNLVGLGILLGYYFINLLLLSTSFNARMYGVNQTYLGTKTLFSYIETLRPTLKPNTLVVTPSEEMSCSEDIFLNGQIGKGEVAFWPLNADKTCLFDGGWEKIASSSAHVILLKYDKNCKCVIEEKIK
ncbi:hypothetical protein ACFL1Q_02190 [Patescibacteria group bacterium]